MPDITEKMIPEEVVEAARSARADGDGALGIVLAALNAWPACTATLRLPELKMRRLRKAVYSSPSPQPERVR